MISPWTFRGKTYQLDTGGILRIIQKSMSTSFNLSRGERNSLAALLEHIIFRVVKMDQMFAKEHLKTMGEAAELPDHSSLALYEVVLPEKQAHVKIQELRRAEAMKVSELLADEKYGDMTATTQGHVVAIYEGEDQVRIRVYVQLGKPANLASVQE